jgi:hypothetical protein
MVAAKKNDFRSQPVDRRSLVEVADASRSDAAAAIEAAAAPAGHPAFGARPSKVADEVDRPAKGIGETLVDEGARGSARPCSRRLQHRLYRAAAAAAYQVNGRSAVRSRQAEFVTREPPEWFR